MGIRLCPDCGGKVSTSRNDCIHCGYIFPETKKCPDCEENVDINVKECPVCGYIFDREINKAKQTTASQQNVVISQTSQEVVIENELTPKKEGFERVEENVAKEQAQVTTVEIKEQIEFAENTKDSICNVLENDVETNKSCENVIIECPYCKEKELMQIGIDFFMCQTCKGKFLSLEEINDTSINEEITVSTEEKQSNESIVLETIEESDEFDNECQIEEQELSEEVEKSDSVDTLISEETTVSLEEKQNNERTVLETTEGKEC